MVSTQTGRGHLFVVSGPSGVGKDTVVAAVLERLPGLYLSISATTRALRPGERDGINYHFLSDAQFDQLLSTDGFLEHATYTHARYGTLRSEVEARLARGLDVILVIEVQGAAQIKAALSEAVLVFIKPPSLPELERRLRERGTDAPEAIAGRLETARLEIAKATCYNYVLVNDDLEQCIQALIAIIADIRKDN